MRGPLGLHGFSCRLRCRTLVRRWTELAAAAEDRADDSAPTATPTLPALRVLLVHGLGDTDVPASLALALAAAAWAHPTPPPLWLALLPAADHYEVAGLCAPLSAGEQDAAAAAARAAAARAGPPAAAGNAGGGTDAAHTAAAIRPWALAAAALRALVAHDDATLGALSSKTREEAETLVAGGALPVCARHTVGSILTCEAPFVCWAEAEPSSAMAMARGLRRWYVWMGEKAPPRVRSWLEERPDVKRGNASTGADVTPLS